MDAPNPYWVSQLALMLLVALHVLTYLFTIWSVDVRCMVRYAKAKTVEQATLVKVVPHKFLGGKDVVTLSRVGGSVEFVFRKLRFGLWDRTQRAFTKLKYPTKKTFDEYRRSFGFESEADVRDTMSRYGPNKFEVPIPAKVMGRWDGECAITVSEGEMKAGSGNSATVNVVPDSMGYGRVPGLETPSRRRRRESSARLTVRFTQRTTTPASRTRPSGSRSSRPSASWTEGAARRRR